jgi:hypothetical protein
MKSFFRFIFLFTFILVFTNIVLANSSQKEDLPKTGGDIICAIGVNCDDDQPVSCMALHCPKPKIPELVKPLPIVIDDTVVCMGLNCPKPNESVTSYLPPPLTSACLGAYIDKNGQLRDVCKERKIKELKEKLKNKNSEIQKQTSKLRKEALEEVRAVKKYQEALKNKKSSRFELKKIHDIAKKEKKEREIEKSKLEKLKEEKIKIEKEIEK